METREFESALEARDVALFDHIETQANVEDKRALLAVHAAVRNSREAFCYLEIGSHRGGSIQPYLYDEKCVRVFSIDKRPKWQPDERGTFEYPDNTTERMLNELRRLSPQGMKKVRCFESDASEVEKVHVVPRPDICFIDGEHTNRAVEADFKFCFSVLAPHGIVLFHDAYLVGKALRRILRFLRWSGVAFRAYALTPSLFVIEMNPPFLGDNMRLDNLRRRSWREFLLDCVVHDMKQSAVYSQLATIRIFRFVLSFLELSIRRFFRLIWRFIPEGPFRV